MAGDGLAGASCAAALARRGWRVTVWGLGAAPASGASGLPVGVAAPVLSADDSPASQLQRLALASTLAYARLHLRPGVDFSANGVLERRVGKKLFTTPVSRAVNAQEMAVLLAHPPTHPTVHPLDQSERASAAGDPVVWHTLGGWVRPAALVRALLATPGVQWQGQTRLLSAHSTGQGAVASTQNLAEPQAEPTTQTADLIVLALGASSTELLGTASGLYPVRGQVSMGRMPAELLGDKRLTAHPINGHGSWVGGIDLGTEPGGVASWVCGATYERGVGQAQVKAEDHAANLLKLQRLLPGAGAAVQQQFDAGQVQGWSGVRCTTADRLPVVGPREAGDCSVWLCTGLGSRGLSWSVWCGELLAARWLGEALPAPPEQVAQVDSLQRLR